MLHIIEKAYTNIDAEMLKRNLAWSVEMKKKIRSGIFNFENDPYGFESRKAKLDLVGSKKLLDILENYGDLCIAEK